jgi:fructosamine-3-kinase
VNVREKTLRERIDPALTPAVLTEIASASLGRNVPVTSWKPLTGGCWNRVIGLQGDPAAEQIVFKISPVIGDAGLRREHAVLTWFSAHTQLPVPRPFALEDAGRLVPGTVLVMSRLPGRPLHAASGSLGPGESRRITIRIAEDLAALHASTARGFGGVERPESERTDWPSFWLPRFDAVIAEVKESGLVGERFMDRIGRIRSGLPAILDIGERSTLTHYDIWSGNVMVHGNGGPARVSGYLDVPGFWADPARELSFAEMFGIADRLFYEVYTSVHRLPEGWQLRRDLYNLKMHLKHITMYPGDGYYREGAARCLATVETMV